MGNAQLRDPLQLRKTKGEYMDKFQTIYVYLVSFTSLGRSQNEKTIQGDHKRVTDFVHLLSSGNGKCLLYTVPGPYDFVSLVWDITGDEAIQVQREIERKGYAKAVLLPAEKHDK
jgi:uncharacterized protein with GYD domain